MHITEIAIKRPVATTMIFLAIAMLGVYSFFRLSIDFLPDINIPKLLIKTECPNVNPEDVETKVTETLEAALSTMQEVRKIHSISRQGLSLIYVEFKWGTDMDMGFIKTRSKLDRIQHTLPEFADRPTVLRFDPTSTPMMILVATGNRIQNPKSLKDYQEALVELKQVSLSILKRRLEQIEGIAYAMISGGLEREIQIHMDIEKMKAFHIGFSEVESALRRFNVMNNAGGMIREGHHQFPLRIQAEYDSIDEIAETPIKYTTAGRVIFLKDIAYIEDGYKERTGYTRLNGREVITLFLFKEAGTNTVETAKNVYRVLHRLLLEYPEFKVIPIFDQAEFVQESIDSVLQSLYWGGIFVVLVLFYFLQNLKNPIAVGISIPISIISTLAAMYFLKINFNIISLGGLALGIGILVDNSIVVIENIHRYREMGYSSIESAIQGTKEVSLAITASTLTTVSVFFPLIYVKGLAGELFYDQSLTITLSLTISLIVSITLLPLLVSQDRMPRGQFWTHWDMNTYMPTNVKMNGKNITRKFFGWVMLIIYAIAYVFYRALLRHLISMSKSTIYYFRVLFDHLMVVYEKHLKWSLQNRGKVLVTVFLLFCATVGATKLMRSEFMPQVARNQLVIQAESPPGTSLESTAVEISRLEEALLRQPGIKRVLSSIGITDNTLDQDYQPGTNKAILDIEIDEEANAFDIAEDLKMLFDQFEGMILTTSQRTTAFEQLFQQQRDLFDIKIFGSELKDLKEMNEKICAFMMREPEFEHVISSFKQGGWTYSIHLNKERLIYYGIHPQELIKYLEIYLKGSNPTQFIDFADKIDIRISAHSQLDLETIQSLQYPLRKRGKTPAEDKYIFVPMHQIITFSPEIGHSEITRENQSRTISITASLQNLSYSQATKKMEEFFDTLTRPEGCWIEIGGLKRATKETHYNLVLILMISLALIYFIISAQFESLRIPVIILVAVPLSFIGIVFTLLLTGNTLNTMSLMGAVVLAGIVVNDSIIKVDFIHRRFMSDSDLYTAVIEAGRKRFRPILMTTVTTICGLLPMALETGKGAELRHPLAWAIIGGISIATLLTLVVVPVIYSVFIKRDSHGVVVT